MGIYPAECEQEEALARLKCAHCQSLINCEALAQAVLAELRRRYRVDRLEGPEVSEVSDAELIEAVREGIARFQLDSSNSACDGETSLA